MSNESWDEFVDLWLKNWFAAHFGIENYLEVTDDEYDDDDDLYYY